MDISKESRPSAEEVLTKSTLRAAEQLGLKQAELGAVLGIHRTTISRLKSKPALDPDSKKGELGLLLIRLAQALYALTGGDEDWIKHFMRSPNKLSGGVPAEQIKSIQGLVTVVQLTSALRTT